MKALLTATILTAGCFVANFNTRADTPQWIRDLDQNIQDWRDKYIENTEPEKEIKSGVRWVTEDTFAAEKKRFWTTWHFLLSREIPLLFYRRHAVLALPFPKGKKYTGQLLIFGDRNCKYDCLDRLRNIGFFQNF